MSMQGLLDQLLKSAVGGAGNFGKGRGDLGKYATGALGGGALAMLLGGKRGGALLRYGSAAAVGAFAWNAYREWQARQPGQASTAPAPPAPASFAQLPAPQQEAHSWIMLRAMIAAAKADGHLDERERGLVETELHRLEADPLLRARVDAELRRPVEPAEVAAGVDTPEQAAEVYLASVLVVDSTSTMERAYLDALAQQLRLPASLKADLEARAAAG
ncbi:MAG: tellurite resistance TerB family protein [Rubrivivax sp.]|nr:tellurite resistance TerB family protein [Rubrivivax sp.]